MDHRLKVGLFIWTLVCLLLRKALSFGRQLKYRGLRLSGRKLSLCLLFLSATLVLLCGDIESNPGPEYWNSNGQEQAYYQHNAMSMTSEGKLDRILYMSMGFEQRFHNLEEHIKSNSREISRKLHSLESSLKENGSQLSVLKQRHDDMSARVDSLEASLERREQHERRANIVLHGLVENREEGATFSIVMRLLSDYFPKKSWSENDVEEVVRLGNYRGTQSRPRPVLIKFSRNAYALLVIRDKEGRNALREQEDVRVAADLSKQQRDTIASYKSEGRHAYYVKGKLIVQDFETQRFRGGHVNPGGRGDNEWVRMHAGNDDARGRKYEARGRTYDARRGRTYGEQGHTHAGRDDARDVTYDGRGRTHDARGCTYDARGRTHPSREGDARGRTYDARGRTHPGSEDDARGRTYDARDRTHPGSEGDARGRTYDARGCTHPCSEDDARGRAPPGNEDDARGRTFTSVTCLTDSRPTDNALQDRPFTDRLFEDIDSEIDDDQSIADNNLDYPDRPTGDEEGSGLVTQNNSGDLNAFHSSQTPNLRGFGRGSPLNNASDKNLFRAPGTGGRGRGSPRVRDSGNTVQPGSSSETSPPITRSRSNARQATLLDSWSRTDKQMSNAEPTSNSLEDPVD